jgi:DNA (cytosine-5)-methyltransferase 1
MRAVLEFFNGAGMARLGLGSGWRYPFANDIDPKKGATYARNFGRDPLLVRDIADVASADLPMEPVDLAWASPPCVDLSEAGRGAGLKGERSGAVWPFLRLMWRQRQRGRAPKVIVIENVTGWIEREKLIPDFIAVVEALAKTGYRIGAIIVDASAFLPQSRERIFIIAVDSGIAIPDTLVGPWADLNWPAPAIVRAYKRLPVELQANWVWWRLPPAPKRQTTLVDMLEDDARVPWYDAAKTQHILGLMDATNLAKVEAAKRSGARTGGTVYRRTRPTKDGGKTQRAEIRFDGIAGALRTAKGGSSKQTVMVIDGDRVRSRLLSPREGARLMGLGADYVLPANATDAYDLIGDGVVVPVVAHIARHILEPLLANADSEADTDPRTAVATAG